LFGLQHCQRFLKHERDFVESIMKNDELESYDLPSMELLKNIAVVDTNERSSLSWENEDQENYVSQAASRDLDAIDQVIA
jgi:hypothetical protein